MGNSMWASISPPSKTRWTASSSNYPILPNKSLLGTAATLVVVTMTKITRSLIRVLGVAVRVTGVEGVDVEVEVGAA
jgi:hypothetical protein